MQKHGLIKYRTIVSEVPSFVFNPVFKDPCSYKLGSFCKLIKYSPNRLAETVTDEIDFFCEFWLFHKTSPHFENQRIHPIVIYFHKSCKLLLIWLLFIFIKMSKIEKYVIFRIKFTNVYLSFLIGCILLLFLRTERFIETFRTKLFLKKIYF